MIDKIAGIDTERVGDAVEPADGNGPHPRFQPADGLGRGRWDAGASNVVQRHAAAFTDLANTGNQ